MKGTTLKRLKIIIFFIRLFNKKYKYCQKCGMPWNKCLPKIIHMSYYAGVFAICQNCWDNLKIDEIIKCYIKLYNTDKVKIICYGTTNYGKCMNYTLDELIKGIQEEYKNSTDLKIERHRKIKLIKSKIKNGRKIKKT